MFRHELPCQRQRTVRLAEPVDGLGNVQTGAGRDSVLTVVERADDAVFGVADVPGVGMPRPVGPGGALVGAVTAWSVQ